ncbi:O-antigen ligase family protein [Enterococcus sp. AZ172]|uniref:O-antigen ligase family protein n=1 Tax=unclassified Enterococcus TaxID=2608891 RepID=UPI003F26E637
MIKNIYKSLFFILLISYIFTYTASYNGVFGIFKYGLSFCMLTYFYFYGINKAVFRILSVLLIPFAFLPMILMIIGYTDILIKNQLINVLYYILFIFLILVAVDLFSNTIEFCKQIQYSVFFSLLFLTIQNRDISINLFSLLNNILANNRGIRTYLGFINPNILALVALVGGLSTIYLIYNKEKNKVFNWISLIFITFIIINAGSRTSFFCILIFLFFIMYFKFLKIMPLKIRIISVTICSVIFMVFFGNMLSQLNIGNWESLDLDTLTSGRLNNQINTYNFLKKFGYLYFGIGNLNSSSFYSTGNVYASLLNTDSSLMYYITTIGIVGLFFIIIFLISLFWRLPNNSYFGKSIFLVWIITSLFEHTLIVPSSLFSFYFLIFILIEINNKMLVGDVNENSLDI